jgi:polar amino acid transport system substrate-binding protein
MCNYSVAGDISYVNCACRKEKKMKKLISVLCAAAMVFSLAACGSSGSDSGSSDTPDASASAEISSGEEVSADDAASSGEQKETLVMGTNAAFPPYEYYDGDSIVGIDADIAAAIADKLGMELQIEDMEFDAITVAVKAGKIDMGMAGMTVTPERLEEVDFSTSYATGIQVVIVPEDSEITSVDDLFNGGYTIGVQTGTTGDIYSTDDFEEPGLCTIERYSKGAEAIMSLTSGKIDCVIIDNEPAKAFVEANEGLKILDTAYTTEDYAICVSKDNTELLDKINTALGELIDDGTVSSILDKYISAE